MGRRRYHERIAAIQGEQLKLVQIQRELEGLVDKVNESINALKVEELQLKSNAVAELKIEHQLEFKSISPDAYSAKGSADCNLEELQEKVNQQQIDLDMFVNPIKGNLIEMEEEDSD